MLRVYQLSYSYSKDTKEAKSFAEALSKIAANINQSKLKAHILHVENERKYGVNYPPASCGSPYEVHIGGIAVVMVDFEDSN